MSLSQFVNEKILPPTMKFVNTRGVTAIKNGMLFSLPFMMIGSVLLIVAFFPIPAVAEFMQSSGITAILMKAFNASMALMATFGVMGIAYAWTEDAGFDGVPCAMLALVCMLIVNPDTVTTPSGEIVSGIINPTWLGGQGMITAIIVGMLTGWGYCWFLRNKITIKLPEQVPVNVARSFTALIPATACVLAATFIYALLKLVFDLTLVELIYTAIQIPLQALADGPLGIFIICFVTVFLWWFGVHGAVIVGGIMGPLLGANSLYNADLFEKGMLTVDNGAKIVTQAFMDQFVTVTGSGMVIGITIFMLFFAKSQHFKAVGKLEALPVWFNINEPVIFGLPIVLNPRVAIPFLLVPCISGISTYLAIYFEIIPPFNGAMVPWTTPPIISGLLVGGWKTALWQALMLFMSFVVYTAFVKGYDAELYKQEQENSAATLATN